MEILCVPHTSGAAGFCLSAQMGLIALGLSLAFYVSFPQF